MWHHCHNENSGRIAWERCWRIAKDNSEGRNNRWIRISSKSREICLPNVSFALKNDRGDTEIHNQTTSRWINCSISRWKARIRSWNLHHHYAKVPDEKYRSHQAKTSVSQHDHSTWILPTFPPEYPLIDFRMTRRSVWNQIPSIRAKHIISVDRVPLYVQVSDVDQLRCFTPIGRKDRSRGKERKGFFCSSRVWLLNDHHWRMYVESYPTVAC